MIENLFYHREYNNDDLFFLAESFNLNLHLFLRNEDTMLRIETNINFLHNGLIIEKIPVGLYEHSGGL